jgi:hypothetical protein
MMEGPAFRMTVKTRIFLFFYGVFGRISQWFIRNCDLEKEALEDDLSLTLDGEKHD